MGNPLCANCQHPASFFLQSPDVNRHLAEDVFDYYRCDNCGLVFQFPITNKLSHFYQNDYYRIPQSSQQLQVDAEQFRYKLQIFQQFSPGKKILEIGPGYGDFAYLAKQAGYHVDAIEMDADCCHFLQSVIGIQVTQSDNPIEALQQLEKYDAIVLWQVIEHLPNPWLMIDVMCEHLLPGGILLLAAPNPESIQFKLFGHKWAHFDAPRHLQFIPISTLTNYISKQGLERISATTNDTESRKANTFGWKKSVMNMLGITISSHKPVVQDKTNIVRLQASKSLLYIAARTILGLVVDIIELICSPIERSGLRGCSYTVVFTKPTQ